MDEWLSKPWYMHPVEYHSDIKRNQVPTHVTTWMNLKNIMLSERNQTQNFTYCMIHLYEIPRIVTFIETECRLVIAKGRREGNMGNNMVLVFLLR